jgi:multidrug efflux system membrane fusion protein
MTNIKNLLVWVCGLGVALFAVAGCNKSSGAPAFAMPPAPVVIAPVITGDVPVYLDEIGRIVAKEVVTIQPQVSGKLNTRGFADGDDVKKGQTLFTIDSRPFQALVDSAQAQLEQAQAQLSIAKVNFQRDASLLPTQAVSQQDYDNAQNAVAVGNANVKFAEAQIETAKLNLEYCTITSPVDGRAGLALVVPGNVVTQNVSQLLVVQELTPIEAEFTIPELELDRVRQEMAQGTLQVEVSTEGDTQPPAHGTLEFLDNVVQDGTGTVTLRALLENKDRRFWPGQFTHVRLVLATLHDAVMIPSEAVQVGQQGSFVFVLNSDGTAAQRDITPGQRQGENIVIEKGLAAGDTVIRSGQLMVQPGSPVNVTNPAATQPAAAGTADASASAGAKP